MIKILVDAFGGDNAPHEIVKGALLGLKNNNDLFVTFTGKQEVVECEIASLMTELGKKELKGLNLEGRYDILDARDVITNSDQPTVAIRTKKDSSLVKAFDTLRQSEDYVGLLSAGSTGAVLTGGFLKIGRIPGVSRPACSPILPTIDGGSVVLVDSGANMDCKPINLVHFAIMASAYSKCVLGVENPRVALVNVGTEAEKGNELTKEVYGLLKDCKEINFVGNMESRDLLSGNYDVVVADAFAGNVLLKATEGSVLQMLGLMKKEIMGSFWAKVGYLFMRKTFKRIKSVLDYNNKGGAVLLGCKKIIVKAHGSSKAKSINACISQLLAAHKSGLINVIGEAVSNLEGVETNEE